MTEKEKTIQHYMTKLNLTHDEALALWQDEQDDNLPDLTAEQKAVEKEMLRADRKVESTPRKRERKADEDKRHLMNILAIAIGYNPDVTDYNTTNPEREAEFIYKGEKYRITLAKPRK